MPHPSQIKQTLLLFFVPSINNRRCWLSHFGMMQLEWAQLHILDDQDQMYTH